MKPKMYSRESNSMLHDHIIDGTTASYHGAKNAKRFFTKEEYTATLEKIIERLEKRIAEFRIKEGMIEATKRLTTVIFAVMFAYMQINGDDLEMRRTSRTRASRTNSRSRRRSEDVGCTF